jgi:hypothetical protein
MDEPVLAPSREAAIEHLEIRVNNQLHRVTVPEMSGAQISALAEAAVGNQLFLETEGTGPDRPIGPDELIRLRHGMKFYDVPVGTFG